MEKTVTLRFYDVSRTSADKPAFADLVRLISNRPLANREKRVGEEGILIRLEDFSEDDGYICGQFIRWQSGNRPGRMLDTGTDALPFAEPLGHGIAFRFRINDGLLAIEYNPVTLSPSRIMSYLWEFDARAEFDLEPRMRDDVWETFEKYPTRKLIIGIAGHPSAGLDNDPDAAVWANVADIRDEYGAETIRIEMSMGHKKGALKNVKRLAREVFRRHDGHIDDVRTLRGLVDKGDGGANEEIDLMGELFDVRVDLSFEENDWSAFYQLKFDLLSDRINLC